MRGANLIKFRCENGLSVKDELPSIIIYSKKSKDLLTGNYENIEYTQDVLNFVERNRNKISYLNVIEN